MKPLPLTGLLYAVFAAMCVKGLVEWRHAPASEPSTSRRRALADASHLRQEPPTPLAPAVAGGRGCSPKRVRLWGAESSGKTTLARALAERYETVWNPEYGHVYSAVRAAPATRWDTWTTAEFVQIARMQGWYEDFLAGFANRVLFCDTDAWTTGLFHEIYLGDRSPEVDALAGSGYDLTIVCDPTIPFRQAEHGTRTDGPHRARMQRAYLARLAETGSRYVVVSGSHSDRMRQAVAAVDALLAGERSVAA